MPKVTITGTTDQVLRALGFKRKYRGNVLPRGTNERALKNKMRADAQKQLAAAFWIVRYNPSMVDPRERILAAMREPKMPTAKVLAEAKTICETKVTIGADCG